VRGFLIGVGLLTAEKGESDVYSYDNRIFFPEAGWDLLPLRCWVFILFSPRESREIFLRQKGTTFPDAPGM